MSSWSRRAARVDALALLLLLSATCFGSDQQPAPVPVPVPASQSFLGDDGQWSPLNVRVGSNSQFLTLLPNTASSETWVIGPGGCDGTFTCQQERGGIFIAGQSTDWVNLGDYRLDFDTQLGDAGFADYGLDTVLLSDSASVDSQIIGILNTTEFWLGQLGLGVHTTRFNGDTNRLSLLSSLVENASLIPSHSYGYTAGAYYRLKNVPCSLTLGGVDANRYVPNSATFGLGPQLQPIVAINEISVRAEPFQTSNAPQWSSNPLILLDNSEADLFTIDSSTPFLWLPASVCDDFADAFGLIYNDTLDLYLFNESSSSPEILTNWNMIFTFSISDMPGSLSNQVDLTLPYAAFDLQLTYPYPNLDANFTSPPTNYFPLRRATSNDQYTIGRAFLQESYLTVDYERNNFSISQAKFSLDALTSIDLVPITRPPNSNWTGPIESAPTGLSVGAIAGATVGAVAIIIIVTLLCLYIFVFKKRRNNPTSSTKHSRRGLSTSFDDGKSSESLAELPSEASQRGFNELPASRRFPFEADSRAAPTELPGETPIEMAAEAVPTSFLSTSSATLTAHGRHRYLIPDSVQHARSASTQKAPLDIEPSVALQPPTSPYLPAYSPTDTLNDAISPNSAHPSTRSGGPGSNTHSSSDRQVSPMDSDAARTGSLPHAHARAGAAGEEPSTSPVDDVGRAASRNFSRPLAPGGSGQTAGVVLLRRLEGEDAGVRPSRPERFSWEGE